ncbi:hypothetical protein FRACYDRAFT_220261, partial [Fragilariopsis cylindrus CCMP1102]
MNLKFILCEQLSSALIVVLVGSNDAKWFTNYYFSKLFLSLARAFSSEHPVMQFHWLKTIFFALDQFSRKDFGQINQGHDHIAPTLDHKKHHS